MEVNPLSVILVKSDSKGDRLLFRYPYHMQENSEPSNTKRKNVFALPNNEDLLQSLPTSNINKGNLTGFTDEVLSSLFAVKPELCNEKFELKVNDVRFVGHPTLLHLKNKKQEESRLLINIVFALQALASHSIVKCYYGLSKRMGIALRHEEQRCGYISEQIQIMVTIHDDSHATSPEHVFDAILEKCTLAKNMKAVYEHLSHSGLVNIRINRWIPLTFCLPQKVHQWHLRGKIVEPGDIDRCLKALRPYHSLLLLYPVQQLNDFTSLDGSPSLTRLLSQYSPLKNLLTLAIDSDITLSHVLELTAHLVYWAKATVIYPICSTNKYVIAPDAPLHLNSPLVVKFSDIFPQFNLIQVISEFSLPTSLGQKFNPLCSAAQQSELVQMIIWMLQHHLLIQLHTYVQYMPTDHGTFVSGEDKLSRLTDDFRNSCLNDIATFNPGMSQHSRTESESETSALSENVDMHLLDADNGMMQTSFNLENASFTSAEDEKPDGQESLSDFADEERSAIFKISASNNPEDLNLFAKLCRKNYFKGNHHIEEIMYLENLRRSQLLQLLDKYRDILITYETEDLAIAMFSYSA